MHTNKQWLEQKKLQSRDLAYRKGNELKLPFRSFRHQRGMAVLAIVAILLSVITFTTISSSQQVQQFYAIDNEMRKAEQARVSFKRQLRDIAESLRTNSVPLTVDKVDIPNVTTAIEVLELEGDQQQPLQHFEVSISSEEESTYYKARFLRYPSLLRLPTPTQQFSWDDQITEWLFNRNVNVLSRAFFPTSIAKHDCLNLAPANIYWIEGNCSLDSEDVAHSDESNPLLLLIVDGNLSLSAETHFFGLIVMLSTAGNEHTLHVATSASIKGAFVSNQPLHTSVYGSLNSSTTVLDTLQAHTTLAKIIPIPGSWFSEE